MRYVIFLALLSIYSATGIVVHAGEIFRGDLVALPQADVTILGEVHDNPAHHDNQAVVISAMKPQAVVFEMLTPKQALGAARIKGLSLLDMAETLQWRGSGWPDFALYYPVFQAASTARIYGGNLPRGKVRQAVGKGAAAVFGPGAAQFGLMQNLPRDEQEKREAGQMAAHCDALPESLLSGMVEAQRLRDAALAAAILAALDETGGPVVVITGNGHARKDWGVPAFLEYAEPDLNVQSLGQFERSVGPDVPYDFHLITDAVERQDPCAAFLNRKG